MITISDREFAVKTSLSIDDVKEGLGELTNLLGNIPDNIDTDISLNGVETVESQIEDLKSSIDIIDDETILVQLDAEDNADSVISGVKNKLEELSGDANTNITIDAEDSASDTIEKIKGELDSLDNVTIDINAEGSEDLSQNLDEANSSGSNLVGTVGSIATAISVAKAESERMGSERSLEKALFYEGLPTTSSYLEDVRTKLAEVQGAIPTEDAARGFYELAKGMRDANDVSIELPHAFSMVKTTGADLDTVMTGLPLIFDTYNITGEKTGEVTDYMANAFLNLKHSSPDEAINATITLTQQLSGLGFSIEDVVGWLGAFDDAGVDTATATSALNIGVRTLASQLTPDKFQGSDAADALKKLGVNAQNADGSFRPLDDILEDVANKLAQMPDGAEKNAIAQELFGQKGYRAWIKLKEGPDEYNQQVETTAKDTEKNMSDINQNTMTLGTQLQKAWNQIVNLPALPSWVFTLGAVIGGITAVLTVGIPVVNHSLQLWDRFNKSLGDSDTNLGKVKNKFSSFMDDIKGKIDEVPKFEIISEEDGVIEEARLNGARSRVSSFVSDIKSKVDELKTEKFKLSDVFGGEDTGTLDTIRTKVEGTVDSVKGKWKSLKGKLNISDWFKDEKGAVDTEFGGQLIDDITKGITSKLPKLGEVGSKVGPTIISGIKTGLKAADMAAIPVTIALMLSDALTNFKDYMKDPMGNIYGPIVDIFMPKQMRGFLSPDKFLRFIVGDAKAEDYYNWVEEHLGKPIRDAEKKLWDDIVGVFTGKNKINLVELIFGTNKKEGEKSPIDATIGDIKARISKFFEDLTKLSPLSIVDILLGKKKDQKQDEDPVNKWVEDTKGKVNKFFEELGKLNPISLVDLLMGKKTGEKKDEDPLSKWIEDSKTKVNKFFEDMGKLNPLSLIDLILGKKSGQKQDEDQLAKWLQDTKTRIDKFFEDLSNLNPLSLVDKIIGRKSGEEDPLVKWINDTKANIQKFLDDITSTAGKWYDMGKQLIDNFIKGMKEAWENNAPDILKKIADYLFQSPAKEGPLSGITTDGFFNYGRDLIKSFSSGIYQELNNSLVPVLKETDWLMSTLASSTSGWGTLNLQNLNNDSANRPFDATTITGYGQSTEWSSWNPLNIDWSKPMSQAIDFTSNFASLFPASPPKTGALASITPSGASEWMQSIMGGMASGVKSGLGGVNSALSSVGEIAGASSASNLVNSASALNSSAKTLESAGKAILYSMGSGGSAGKAAMGGATIQVDVHEGAVKITGESGSAGKAVLYGGNHVYGAGAYLGQVIKESLKNNGITVERW